MRGNARSHGSSAEHRNFIDPLTAGFLALRRWAGLRSI
jgi:hypothetical protein